MANVFTNQANGHASKSNGGGWVPIKLFDITDVGGDLKSDHPLVDFEAQTKNLPTWRNRRVRLSPAAYRQKFLAFLRQHPDEQSRLDTTWEQLVELSGRSQEVKELLDSLLFDFAVSVYPFATNEMASVDGPAFNDSNPISFLSGWSFTCPKACIAEEGRALPTARSAHGPAVPIRKSGIPVSLQAILNSVRAGSPKAPESVPAKGKKP